MNHSKEILFILNHGNKQVDKTVPPRVRFKLVLKIDYLQKLWTSRKLDTVVRTVTTTGFDDDNKLMVLVGKHVSTSDACRKT